MAHPQPHCRFFCRRRPERDEGNQALFAAGISETQTYLNQRHAFCGSIKCPMRRLRYKSTPSIHGSHLSGGLAYTSWGQPNLNLQDTPEQGGCLDSRTKSEKLISWRRGRRSILRLNIYNVPSTICFLLSDLWPALQIGTFHRLHSLRCLEASFVHLIELTPADNVRRK